MKISVIVPVHNGGEDLHSCLEAIKASSRLPDEIIVIDDSSTDGTVGLALEFGAKVSTLANGPYGPATARNLGAAAAKGDILVFVDADVALHHDTLEKIEGHLSENPAIAALFGSYDDAPPKRGMVTLYKNLMHHFVHQHGRREASTFWAGCGAIRSETFAAVGGFDESYTRPSIEDIELGARLRQSGHRVWLCRDVLVTHLKNWNLVSLLRADIRDRAIPWTHLILSASHLPSDLNLDRRSRISALVVWTVVIMLFLSWWLPWSWIGALVGAAALGFLNASLYRFLARRGGVRFAMAAFGLHALYFLYSSAIFGSLVIWHLPQKASKGSTLGLPKA